MISWPDEQIDIARWTQTNSRVKPRNGPAFHQDWLDAGFAKQAKYLPQLGLVDPGVEGLKTKGLAQQLGRFGPGLCAFAKTPPGQGRSA